MSSESKKPFRPGVVLLSTTAVVGFVLASHVAAQHYVESDDMEFPRVQYADSLVSLNDRCIVRLRKLSPKVPAVYVNGRPIGFC